MSLKNLTILRRHTVMIHLCDQTKTILGVLTFSIVHFKLRTFKFFMPFNPLKKNYFISDIVHLDHNNVFILFRVTLILFFFVRLVSWKSFVTKLTFKVPIPKFCFIFIFIWICKVSTNCKTKSVSSPKC